MKGDVQTRDFRGHSFQFIEGEEHASVFTFEDEQALRDTFWNIQEGDVVYDVGAAYGSYALPALALGATVYAFEPLTRLYDAMEANVRANSFDKFHLYRVALGNVEKEGNLTQELMAHGSSIKAASVDGNNHSVPFRTLDSYLGKIEPPTWVKLDVEGQELDVIEGGRETFRKYRPKLLAEIHLGVIGIDHYMRINGVYEDIQRFLKRLGYHITEHPYGGRLHIYANLEVTN